jgi:hypothetical protein
VVDRFVDIGGIVDRPSLDFHQGDHHCNSEQVDDCWLKPYDQFLSYIRA